MTNLLTDAELQEIRSSLSTVPEVFLTYPVTQDPIPFVDRLTKQVTRLLAHIEAQREQDAQDIEAIYVDLEKTKELWNGIKERVLEQQKEIERLKEKLAMCLVTH